MGANMPAPSRHLTLRAQVPLVGTVLNVSWPGFWRVRNRSTWRAKLKSVDGRTNRSAGVKTRRDEAGGPLVWISITSTKIHPLEPEQPLLTSARIVRQGDVIARGWTLLATVHRLDLGEFGVGQNIAYRVHAWNGYNFEDSILISGKVVQEDRPDPRSIFTRTETCVARDYQVVSEGNLRRPSECG